MPRSSGTYAPPSGVPFVNGTVADETVMNAVIDDLGDEITNSIARDGQSPATANLPMAGFRHTGVGDGSARNHYAAAGQVQDGALTALGSVAGTNTITASLSPAITAYVAHMLVVFKPAATNTGAVTIALNGLVAKSIVKYGSTALVAGDLAANIAAVLVYDGTNFLLLNPQHPVANDEVTLARIQNIATDRLIGRDTASSGDAEELTVGGGIEFTGSGGIQRSALTGDVTAAAGSNSTTIADAAVTLAKMANLAQDQFIVRTTASTGVPQTATCTAFARTLLDDVAASNARTTLGLGTAATSATGDFAAAAHNQAASTITSGTFANARIAESNVTQHEAALAINAQQLTTTVSTQTGASYSVLSDDVEEIIIMNRASTQTVTLNSGTHTVGSSTGFIRRGAGAVNFAAGAGQTINSPGGALGIAVQHGKVVATYIATNTWELSGDLG